MTDKELLELAAKAAGTEFIQSQPHPVSGVFWGLWLRIKGEPHEGQRRYWNPLTDDGDALRLAVKLEMQLRLRHSENEISAYGSPDGRIDEGVRGDPLSATRRAIVRTAAEICRGKP